MLFRRKRETRTYDRETQKPVIRASICTGEKAAGFQDLRTGKFTEVMLLLPPAAREESRPLSGSGGDETPTQYEKGGLPRHGAAGPLFFTALFADTPCPPAAPRRRRWDGGSDR